jgi:hypothetical protein
MTSLCPRFAAGDTRLNKLPGWEKNSWGYHGDDGYSFSAEKAGSTYGPTFGGIYMLCCSPWRMYV